MYLSIFLYTKKMGRQGCLASGRIHVIGECFEIANVLFLITVECEFIVLAPVGIILGFINSVGINFLS